MSRRFLVLTLMTTTALAGCHTCQKAGYVAQKPCGICNAGPIDGRLAPVPVAPPPSAHGGVMPPAYAPPAGETPPPPRATIDPPVPAPPVDRQPPPETTPPSVQLGTPGPRRSDSARLPIDPTRESPQATVPKPPTVGEERDPPQPTDVPGYVLARPNVATGLKPFPDGINWLRERGYRAVLHLRAPGEDTAAAKRQFEKKGLTYLTLEVSPRTLSRADYEAFVRVVLATENHPLYVFDQNGGMGSALWYLYFRVKMGLADDKALAEVKRIGLRVEDDDDHKKAWLAAQKLLGTLKP